MNARERLVLRIGAVAICMGWALLRGLPALTRSERQLRDRVAEKAAYRARSSDDISALDSLAVAATRVQPKVKAMAPRLLSGTTASAASADISARARSLVESQGARVEGMENAGDTTVSVGLRRSGLRVELTTDIAGLFAVLRAFERSPAVLMVSSVRIVGSDGAVTSELETLRIELGVAGLYLPAKGTP
jgi:hypothetical protein